MARCALFFDVDLPALDRRLLLRGETSGRTDDNLAVIRKRFATFARTSMPVLAHLERSMAVHRIDGAADIEIVFTAAERALRLGPWGGAAASAADFEFAA